jgi:hypothetical protein
MIKEPVSMSRFKIPGNAIFSNICPAENGKSFIFAKVVVKNGFGFIVHNSCPGIGSFTSLLMTV